MKHYGKLLHINTLIIFRADKNKVSYSLEHRISRDLKGCFCHFTKWQTHPLKSKEMIGKCVKQILPCSPGQSPSSQDPVLDLGHHILLCGIVSRIHTFVNNFPSFPNGPNLRQLLKQSEPNTNKCVMYQLIGRSV